jgi:large subunit ribosomal protein L23
MRNSYDVIKAMVRTEKGSLLLPLNKYLFWVDRGANKIEVKQAVKDIYNVTPTKVNIINVKGKWKRLRYHEGKTSGWKKALVTLKSGEKIDVT